jgi:tRNA dimethylallyltransferase
VENPRSQKRDLGHPGGDLSLEDAIALTQQGHRNYAKRQMTWFRREPNVCWLDGFGDDPAIAMKANATVERELNSHATFGST